MFSLDESLPPLPLPELRHTLEVYLESVKPHVTEEEFQHTSKLVNEFEKRADASKLQGFLEERANNMKNWVHMKI